MQFYSSRKVDDDLSLAQWTNPADFKTNSRSLKNNRIMIYFDLKTTKQEAVLTFYEVVVNICLSTISVH